MPAQAVTAAPLPAQLFSVAVSGPGLNGLDQSILENNQFIHPEHEEKCKIVQFFCRSEGHFGCIDVLSLV